ncbi:TPA: conjugal transfer protein TrbA [Yersinia enterocolitica]
MQRRNPNNTQGDDSLLLIGGCLILIVLIWFLMGSTIIYGVCRLLFMLYDVLPTALAPADVDARKVLLYQAAIHSDKVGLGDFISVMNETAIIFLPLYLLVASLFAWIILKSPFYRLTRKISIKTLPWIRVKHAPANAHVLARFGQYDQLLLNEDPEEAKSALSPVEFVELHNLLDTEHCRLRKKAAHKVFLSQVNQPSEGSALQLAPHEKVLAAAFVYVRFMSQRPAAKQLLDAVNLSCLRTKDGFPDFTLGESDWEAVSQSEEFRTFCRGRRSSRTLLHALMDDDLQVPPAQFRWLKGIDRTLWMALSSVGRGKFFVEGAGVIAWSLCETRNQALSPDVAADFPPTVRAAVLGLERELIRYKRVIPRIADIPLADALQEEDAPPFALASDGDPLDDNLSPAPSSANESHSPTLTDDIKAEAHAPAKQPPAPSHLEL